MTPQSVEQRVTGALQKSRRELWQAAMSQVVRAEARVCPLLAKFT